MKRGYVVPSDLILIGLLLWIPRQRSMRLDDWFVFSRHNGLYARGVSAGGAIRCEWAAGDPFSGGFRWSIVPDNAMIGMSSGRSWGWDNSIVGEIPNSPAGDFAVSYLVLISAFLGAGLMLGAIRWRKDARKRKSLENQICVKCGYDLRASGDRCPECGTLQQVVST